MTYAIYPNRSTCFLICQQIVDHFPHFSKMEAWSLKRKGELDKKLIQNWNMKHEASTIHIVLTRDIKLLIASMFRIRTRIIENKQGFFHSSRQIYFVACSNITDKPFSDSCHDMDKERFSNTRMADIFVSVALRRYFLLRKVRNIYVYFEVD